MLRLKRNRLYYHIRLFNKITSERDMHFHVTQLFDEPLPNKYWYDIVMRMYELADTYIRKKRYANYLMLCFRVKMDKKHDLCQHFNPTKEPYSIYFLKESPAIFLKRTPLKYSSKLSKKMGMNVFVYQYNCAKNERILFLVPQSSQL